MCSKRGTSVVICFSQQLKIFGFVVRRDTTLAFSKTTHVKAFIQFFKLQGSTYHLVYSAWLILTVYQRNSIASFLAFSRR